MISCVQPIKHPVYVNFISKIIVQMTYDNIGNGSNVVDDDEDDLDDEAGCLSRFIMRCQGVVHSFWERFGERIKIIFYVLLVAAYFAYFAYALYYHFGDEGSIRLLWVTSLVVVCMALKLAYNCCRKHTGGSISDWPLWTFMRQHHRAINW